MSVSCVGASCLCSVGRCDLGRLQHCPRSVRRHGRGGEDRVSCSPGCPVTQMYWGVRSSPACNCLRLLRHAWRIATNHHHACPTKNLKKILLCQLSSQDFKWVIILLNRVSSDFQKGYFCVIANSFLFSQEKQRVGKCFPWIMSSWLAWEARR